MRHRHEIINKAKREGVRVEDYTLLTSVGQSIRKATRVIFPDGHEILFTERMGKKDAIWQAIGLIGDPRTTGETK